MDDKTKNIVNRVSILYHDYGIKGVTMDDVSHKLAISKKTLYQLFKDKKELVWAVLENDCETKSTPALINNNNTSAIDDLFAFYDVQVNMIKNHKPAFMYDLKKYYPEIFSHFQKIKHKNIVENIKENLIKGKRQQLYRNDINEDILSRLGLMRIEGLMNSSIFNIEEIISEKLFSEIFKYNLFGIVSDKGREIIVSKFKNKKFYKS